MLINLLDKLGRKKIVLDRGLRTQNTMGETLMNRYVLFRRRPMVFNILVHEIG